MKRFFIAVFLLFLSFACLAATYYVDYNAADDSANGTTSGTPWKRAPGMVDFAGSYSNSPGDVILLKGGVTWLKEALPLTVGYPSITFRAATAGEWAGSTGRAVFDGESTDITLLLWGDAHDSVTIKGINFTGSARSDPISYYEAVLVVGSKDAHDGTIEDCYFDANLAAVSVLVLGYPGTRLTGWSIKDNTIYGGLKRAIHIGNAVTLENANGWNGGTIEDNVIYGPEYDATSSNDDDGDGLYMQLSGGVTVRNNTIYVRVNHSTPHADGFQISYDLGGHEIYKNWIESTLSDAYDNTSMLYVTDNAGVGAASASKIYNNVFAQTKGITGVVYIGASNITFLNNTLYAEDNAACMRIYERGDNLTVKNNIFRKTTDGGWKAVDITSGVTGLVLDYNQYYVGAGTGGNLAKIDTNYRTLATLRSEESLEANGQEGDPVLVTEGSDFHLQGGSPCIDQGEDLSGLGFSDDYDGISRPQGGAWDIGAYEYYTGGEDPIPPAEGPFTANLLGTLSQFLMIPIIQYLLVLWGFAGFVGMIKVINKYL